MKLSNGDKLHWFITNGESARLVVGDSTGFTNDREFSLSESQQKAIKDFIDNELLPSQTISEYTKYINKKVIFYSDDEVRHVGYLAVVMPKDPDFPFGIYQGKHGENCPPEEAYDVVFVSHVKPMKEDK